MDKKNIITIAIVLMVHDWELAFPMSAERNECWQFVRQWMKFIKGTDRVFECGDIMKVKLHGVFSSGDHLQDGVYSGSVLSDLKYTQNYGGNEKNDRRKEHYYDYHRIDGT